MMINSSTRPFLRHKWYELLNYVLKTVWCHLSNMSLLKILVQENHSANLCKHWMSNIILLFAGYVMLKKSVRQSKKAISCVQSLQSAVVIKKRIKRSKNPSTIGLYTIIRLCNIQYKMIVFVSPLIVTPKNNLCQNFHFKYLYDNCTIPW